MNKRQAIIITGVVLLVLALGISLSRLTRGFELAATDPKSQQTLSDPNSSIVLHFNQKLGPYEPSITTISVAPVTPFDVSFEDKSIILKPRKKLANTDYNIVLNNIPNHEGRIITSVALSFTVHDGTSRGQFIDSLPYYGAGFTINYLSSGQFTIQITELPEDAKRHDAEALLRSKGIELSQEEIVYEVLRSVRGSGAPPSVTDPF